MSQARTVETKPSQLVAHEKNAPPGHGFNQLPGHPHARQQLRHANEQI